MLKKTQCTILITLMYMLGIFSFFQNCELLISIIVFFVTIFLLLTKKAKSFLAISMTLSFIIGVIYTRAKINSDELLKSIAPTQATIIGKVVSIPTSTLEDKTKFFINVKSVNTKHDHYLTNSRTYLTLNDIKENYKNIKIGDDIKINAYLRIPQEATNPSQFSYRNYLKNFNVFTTAYSSNKNWEIISAPTDLKWKFIQNLNILRHKIISKHNKIIKSPNIEVLGGIVFGDDAISPPEDIKESFIHSGLMHILAASGLNVALIFGIWFFIFSKLKIPYKLGITTGIFLILAYTLMTGLGPPVLRAALMLIFGLIGKLIDRDADNIALLFLVATLILIYNPAYLFDVGFQLSFIVTLGLLSFCPIFAEKTKSIPQSIAGAIYVPFIAQVVVAPIQMYYFNTFALYSIIANIVSLPLVSAISFLGFTSSILTIIPKCPNFIISVFDYIMNPILSALIWISNFFSSLPNALLQTTQCNSFQIIIYYLTLTFIFFGTKNGFNKKITTALCTTIIIILLSTIQLKNNNLEAIFFNVGNAETILVKTPNNKYTVIDTARPSYKGGFSQVKAILYEYLKDNGIKEIEYLIITHYDTDHAGGACELMKLIKVQNILLNPIKDTELSKEIEKTAKDKSINIIYAKNNSIYPYKDGEMKIFINTKSKNSNNSSIVTLFTKDRKNILFTGDADLNTIKNFNLPKTIDILKIAHHGAFKTTDIKFLKDKNIKTAIISTGPNQYAHPAFETLYNLQASKVQILRTDVDNAIKTIISNKDTEIFVFNSKRKKWEKTN